MKATEIKLTFEKTDDQYNKIWLGITYSLLPGDDVQKCIQEAKKEIDNSYNLIVKCQKVRTELLPTNPRFKSICEALKTKNTTIAEIENIFVIGKDAMKYFAENNLL